MSRKTTMLLCALAVGIALSGLAIAGEGGRRVVIFDNVATEVGPAFDQSKDAWVTKEDLTRATGFEIKPQGVCREELCFPLPKGRQGDFIAKRGAATWFNLSEFARLLKQPLAVDEKHATWFFGPRPASQNEHIQSLEAPNFTLPDINGKMHSLSDFRGKKVLLITWASW